MDTTDCKTEKWHTAGCRREQEFPLSACAPPQHAALPAASSMTGTRDVMYH